MEVVGQPPVGRRTVHPYAGNFPLKAGKQPVAHAGEARALGRHALAADFRGAAESDDAGDVERSRAKAVLVAAAVDLARERKLRLAAADVESAGALRAVVLVTGEGQQIHAKLRDVQWDLPGGLRRIGVQEHAALLRD